MASTKRMVTKSGKVFYEIRAHVSRGRPTLTMRWYPNEGWGKRTIEHELKKVAAEFDRRIKEGEVLSSKERQEFDAIEKATAEAEAKLIRTFKEYAEQVFMPAKKITCAEKTRKYYQNALDNHLYEAFGDSPLKDISPAQLSAFFLSKQASGLAHSTVNGIFVTAKQLFDMAYLDDTISFNPITKVKRPRQKKDDKRSDPPRFTVDEVKEIKKHLSNEPLKWQALIMILISTGMRRGEVCGITWDKIDFSNRTIKIDGNLGYTPEMGVYRERPKTDSGDRVVPITEETADILRRYKEEQASDVERRTIRLTKDHKPLDPKKTTVPDYLFTVRGRCDPIYPDTVNRYFKRFGETYGIEDFHPHKLRHTAISIMLENGVPEVTVAAIAGHEDASVTHKIYAHASDDGKLEAIKTLDEAIK